MRVDYFEDKATHDSKTLASLAARVKGKLCSTTSELLLQQQKSAIEIARIGKKLLRQYPARPIIAPFKCKSSHDDADPLVPWFRTESKEMVVRLRGRSRH